MCENNFSRSYDNILFWILSMAKTKMQALFSNGWKLQIYYKLQEETNPIM